MDSITVLIKPASYHCNLNCTYCFYCDEVKERNSGQGGIMTEETANSIIGKVSAFCSEGATINYMFQGGEPLLAGYDFFKDFTEKAIKNAPDNAEVNFSLQTNGTMIDDQFCVLFKKYDYLIGVSIDGPEKIHNKYRSESFTAAMAGIELLKKHEIETNILSVITADTDATELWNFYLENGFDMVQTIYCLDPLDGQKSDYSLDAMKYARFKKRLFNKWYDKLKKDEFFYVRDFDNLLSYITTGETEQCGFLGDCSPQLVIESDGTCYSCDFYCLDKFSFGNINEISLNKAIRSKRIEEFVDFNTPLNKLCKDCEVIGYCGGGCKRYRSLYNSIEGYCPQRDFLLHALPKLDVIIYD